MRNIRRCTICGKSTTKLLFNDKMLGIPVCSRKCEYEYLNTLTNNKREQINMLRYLDGEIEKNKQHEKIGWTVAGFGLLITVIGFFIADVIIFVAGVCPLTCGALSTRHFEDKRYKLTKLRKRIAI